MEVMAVDTDTQMVVSEDGEEDRRVAAQPGPSGVLPVPEGDQEGQ